MVITTYLLVFLSGVTALIYQVLWMKQLGLLFGNTAHAAGATLAAFFAGLAVGSWFWGRRCTGNVNALRTYAGLEGGIALTALFYFFILRVYYVLYPLVYQRIDSAVLLLLIKFGLALVLIFPSAFCMGGTIPVIAHHLIRRPGAFGSTAAMLYAINTLGAALGACLAGFYLPLWLGFRNTCAAAIAVTGLIAVTAYRLSRTPNSSLPGMRDETAGSRAQASHAAQGEGVSPLPKDARWVGWLVCFLSGFGVLALEVLWTRMFSQVLENSVYTFAAILVIVLLCLAAGAFISSRLARWTDSPRYPLVMLLLLSGMAVSTTPFVFMIATDALQIVVSRGSWFDYMMLIFRKGFMVIGFPALLLGTIFPFLLKHEEKYALSAGKTVGHLAAINTVGAILGSFFCGFFFLEKFGMWGTMRLIAVLYLATALVLPVARNFNGIALKIVIAVFLILQFSALDPTHLTVHSVDELRPRQEILETWEGSSGTVAVARDQFGLSIKVNSHYGLGSTGAAMQEKLQADIPLMIHPDAASLFFLGMGTGITAGSALDPQFEKVERVVTCELIPEVITAAKKYIAGFPGYDFTGGLFTDPRATVLAEDGRHYLMATPEHFDLVIADLFVPFRSGAGSLYTQEHFAAVKQRLEPGGLFFQWLPLYQLTENEFYIISRTMLDVFDQVTLWRNSFQPGQEVVALVGHLDAQPFPATDVDSQADKIAAVAGRDYRDLQRLSLPFNPQTILLFYGGNITLARSLFDAYPVNRDDKPLIEYMAPRSYRSRTDTKIPWFTGPRIIELIEEVQRLAPPQQDPLLVHRSSADRRLVEAGTAFHRARLWEVIGDEVKCRAAWHRFVEAWTDPPAQ